MTAPIYKKANLRKQTISQDYRGVLPKIGNGDIKDPEQSLLQNISVKSRLHHLDVKGSYKAFMKLEPKRVPNKRA